MKRTRKREQRLYQAMKRDNADSEIVVRILKPESTEGLKKDTLHLSYLDPFNEKELLNKFASEGYTGGFA